MLAESKLSSWFTRNNSFILNQLTVSPIAAYSLRKLNTNYSGNCINVRRSSDNATQDIGFVNGKLDTASLLSFCSYDQSRVWNTGTLLATGIYGIKQLANGDVLVLNSTLNSVYRSTDNGATFGAGVAVTGASAPRGITQLTNGTVLVVTNNNSSCVRSTDNGATWGGGVLVETSAGLYGITQLANGDVLVTGAVTNKVYRSTDNGLTWNAGVVVTGASSLRGIIQLANGDILVAASGISRIYKSTDNGATWDSGVVITGSVVNSLIQLTNGTVVAVGSGTNRAYRSTDNGATWDSGTLVETGAGLGAITQLANGNVLATGFTSGNVYKSASAGFITTWYDQSGNGTDASQPTAGIQPQIVLDGQVQTLNSIPTISFLSASTQYLRTNANIAVNSAASMNAVSNALSPTQNSGYCLLTTFYPASGNIPLVLGDLNNGGVLGAGSFDGASHSSSYSGIAPQTPFIATARYSGTAINLYVNGTGYTAGSTSAGLTATQPLRVGTRWDNATLSYNGNISEAITFLSALSTTDRQTLERNQEQFYSISGI